MALWENDICPNKLRRSVLSFNTESHHQPYNPPNKRAGNAQYQSFIWISVKIKKKKFVIMVFFTEKLIFLRQNLESYRLNKKW